MILELANPEELRYLSTQIDTELGEGVSKIDLYLKRCGPWFSLFYVMSYLNISFFNFNFFIVRNCSHGQRNSAA